MVTGVALNLSKGDTHRGGKGPVMVRQAQHETAGDGNPNFLLFPTDYFPFLSYFFFSLSISATISAPGSPSAFTFFT